MLISILSGSPWGDLIKDFFFLCMGIQILLPLLFWEGGRNVSDKTSVVSVCHAEKEALRDISMEIEEGTLTLLTGPSGSGKSTLLRHLKKELMPAGRRREYLYKGTD